MQDAEHDAVRRVTRDVVHRIVHHAFKCAARVLHLAQHDTRDAQVAVEDILQYVPCLVL